MLVPAHNEAATIERVVETIRASTYPVGEIIVVADACTDETAALARAAGATVFETTCGDKAEAQNSVLALIETDLVVGFDGDTFPDEHCIERMVSRMRRDGLDAACATVLPIQPTGFFIRARRYAYALGRRWWRAAQSIVGRVQVLTGACYVFKTEAIKAIGGFPSVGISADMDATWSLHKAGYKLAYVGEATAYTVDPETFAGYKLQMQRWAAGYFQTMAKHRGQLWHPKALLVVWTGLFDLLCIPLGYVMLIYYSLTNPEVAYGYGVFFLLHLVVTTILVATVVGPKEAIMGAFPYTVVNMYNKYLYLWSFTREWLLDSHYASWTGRHGRGKVVTPIQFHRVCFLVSIMCALAAAYLAIFGPHRPPLWLLLSLFVVAPALAVLSVSRDRADWIMAEEAAPNR